MRTKVEAAYNSTGASGVMLAFGGSNRDQSCRRALEARRHDHRQRPAFARRCRRSRKNSTPHSNASVLRARRAKLHVRSAKRAPSHANSVSPVIVRPSYVLGGRGMEIVYNEGQLASYVESAPPITPGAPLLVDKYLRGLEVEVDAAFDGDDILVPGIFEHVERAGIHSGDSISVYPTQDRRRRNGRRASSRSPKRLRANIGIRGLINIQFVIHQGDLYIIEANPRASRTVPIISKATGINLVAAATRIALGEKLRDMPWGTGLRPKPDYVVVKVPVFSFAKMRGVETMLGPEMKSTGEVLGIDATYAGALRKGFVGAGIRLPESGGRVLVSIGDDEKESSVDLLRRLVALGHSIVATKGTHALLERHGIPSQATNAIADGSPNVLDVIAARSVDLVINTAAGARGLTRQLPHSPRGGRSVDCIVDEPRHGRSTRDGA